jgi:hypothetical protein
MINLARTIFDIIVLSTLNRDVDSMMGLVGIISLFVPGCIYFKDMFPGIYPIPWFGMWPMVIKNCYWSAVVSVFVFRTLKPSSDMPVTRV